MSHPNRHADWRQHANSTIDVILCCNVSRPLRKKKTKNLKCNTLPLAIVVIESGSCSPQPKGVRDDTNPTATIALTNNVQGPHERSSCIRRPGQWIAYTTVAIGFCTCSHAWFEDYYCKGQSDAFRLFDSVFLTSSVEPMRIQSFNRL